MADFQLNFSDDRLIEILDKAFKSADRLDKKVDELQANLNQGFDTKGNASQKLNKTLSDSAKSAVEADKAISKFGVSAGLSFAKFNLLAGVVEGAGRQVVGFASNIVTLGAGLESVETNFTTFLGSADAAKALIAELNKFAAKTPFSQNEIFAQSEKLLGFGFAAEEVTDTLRRLGDISGGSAEKLDGLVLALGQVRAKQRVQGEELLQFAERGVPIYDALAQAIGKSVPETQDLVSKGKVGFADLQKAIKLLTDEGGQFSGVLAAQSQTLTGLYSTLTGNFEQLQAELGKKLLPFLKDVVIEANNIISAIDPQAIADTFSEAGQVVAPFVDAIKQGFSEDILPALLRFRDAIQGVIDRFGDFFNRVNEQGAVVEFLKSVIEGVSFAFGLLVDDISFAVGAVSDFVAPIVNALAPAVNTLLRVFSEVVDVVKNLGIEGPKAGGIFSTLGKSVGAVVLVFSRVVEAIGAVISAILNIGEASKSTSPVVRAISDGMRIFVSELGKFFSFIGDIVNGVGIGVDKVSSKIDGVLKISAAFGVVKNEISEFITIVSDFAEAFGGFIDRVKARILDVTGLGAVSKFFQDKINLLNQESEAQAKLNAEKKKAEQIQANAQDDFNVRADQVRFEQELTRKAKAEEEKRRKVLAEAKQKSQSELDKAEKERQKLLEERQKLRLSLIEDETEKARELERIRYEEQLADIKKLTKGDDQEQYDQQQAALRIHEANLEEIRQDAADKVKGRNAKILEQERKFQEERDSIRADVVNIAAENEKALGDLQIEIAEAAGKNYIEKIKANGASEQAVKRQQAEFDLIIQKLRLESEIKFQEALLAATSAGDEQRRKEIGAQLTLLKTQLDGVNFDINLNADANVETGGILDKVLNLKSSIADALKLDPETFDGLFADAKSAFGSFFDSIKSLSDLQIEQNNRVIESLNEKIEVTKEALKREQEDKEKGYANDIKTQQDALDALNAQKEAAEQKNRELQAKQTRFQLLQDTATQVSGIATSVVNIIKGTSAIPFVGIALAAVQVAALFALLASARAQSRAATRLHKGGRIPWGKTDENGKQGYMIEDTGIMVGGSEWVINRKTSEEHDPFLKKLNAGKYKGVDLEELADGAKRRTNTRETILNEIVTHVLKRVHRGQVEHSQLFGENERFEKTRVVEIRDIERTNKARHSKEVRGFDIQEITNYLNERIDTKRHINIKEEIEALRKSLHSKTAQRFDVDQVFNYLNERSETTKRFSIRDEIETLNRLQRSKELQRFDIEEITNYMSERSRVENTMVFELVDIAKHLIERNSAEKTHINDLTDIAKYLEIKEESEVFKQLKHSSTAQRFDLQEITNYLSERSRIEKTRTFELNDITKYLRTKEDAETLNWLKRSTVAQRFNTEQTENHLTDIAKNLNIKEESEVFRVLRHSKELQHSELLQRFDMEEITNHLSERGRVELEKVMYLNEQTRRTREAQTELVRDLFVRQTKTEIPDFSAAIEFQAARINRAANTINVHNTTVNNQQAKRAGSGGGITAKEVKKMLEENTNRILRSGFLPLQQLGQRTVAPDGTETHYQIDPALNTRTTVKKK